MQLDEKYLAAEQRAIDEANAESALSAEQRGARSARNAPHVLTYVEARVRGRAADAARIAAALEYRALQDRTPEQVAEDDVADRATLDADHAQWLASGESDNGPTLLASWRIRRKAERAAAEVEWDEIIGSTEGCTDEECEAAFAGWHAKHDHLFKNRPPKGTVDMSANIVPMSPRPSAPAADMIQSSGEFVQGFVPPDYLVDGILQRRFCYSMTAQTGVGKTTVAMLISAHVSMGRPLGNLEVTKGTVLYLAGENPTDIQMRWLGLTRELKIDPGSADVHFLAGPKDLSQHAEAITAEVARKGMRLALVVVDTAAAYNTGDDENSNAQAGAYARQLRSLVNLPGGPCVVILCHPTKRAAADDLIPRGGGAFLAEVDGNIALQKREALVVASAQGKFRGPEFAPISFALKTVFHPTLKDARGRDIPTVVAHAISEAEGAQMTATARRHEDLVLKSVDTHPAASVRERAAGLGWRYAKSGKEDVSKVSRALKVLEAEKLVRSLRGRWELTAAGEKELNRLDLARRDIGPLISMIPSATAIATPHPPMPPPMPPQ